MKEAANRGGLISSEVTEEGCSMSRYVIGKPIIAVVGIIGLWQLFNARRTMKIRWHGLMVDRYKDPKLFWSLVFFYCFSIFLFLGGILFSRIKPSQPELR
jgi:hypothetical protein